MDGSRNLTAEKKRHRLIGCGRSHNAGICRRVRISSRYGRYLERRSVLRFGVVLGIVIETLLRTYKASNSNVPDKADNDPGFRCR